MLHRHRSPIFNRPVLLCTVLLLVVLSTSLLRPAVASRPLPDTARPADQFRPARDGYTVVLTVLSQQEQPSA